MKWHEMGRDEGKGEERKEIFQIKLNLKILWINKVEPEKLCEYSCASKYFQKIKMIALQVIKKIKKNIMCIYKK